MSDRQKIAAIRLALIAVALGGWQIAAEATDLVAPVIPAFRELVDGFREGDLGEPAWSSIRAAFGGFALAVVVALPVGYVLGRSRYLRETYDPVIAGLFSVPRILIYPVMLSIFGIGLDAKLVLGALAAFFPMVITTTAAIHALDPILIRLARSLGANPVQTFVKFELPATAPSIVAAVRLGFSVSFVTVILSEMFVTDAGLGQVVTKAYGLQQQNLMYGVVALIFIGALVVNLALWSVERRLRPTE